MKYEIEPCVITKDVPEPPGRSHHVGISAELYDELAALSRKTGRTIRYLNIALVRYALKHVVIKEEE